MNPRSLLVETHAHMPPVHILEEISGDDALRRVPNISHSIAEIVAHMDFWQSWFLLRCRGENVPWIESASLGWQVVAGEGWTAVRERFTAGIEEAADLASQADLLEMPLNPAIEFPPLAAYTVRDSLIHAATHNAHHLGQIVILRQLMECWPPPAGSWTW